MKRLLDYLPSVLTEVEEGRTATTLELVLVYILNYLGVRYVKQFSNYFRCTVVLGK